MRHPRTRKTVLFTTTALLSAYVLSLRGQEQPPDSVVAVVEGRKVTYKEIRMPPESLRLQYRLKYGKDPKSKGELEQLAGLAEKSEKGLLASRIKSIIRARQVERFGIIVTNEELEERQRQLFSGVDLEAALTKQREALTPLIQALRAVLRKEMDQKLAYETYLVGHMPYEHWLVQMQYYNTPKRMVMLEEYLQKTPQEIRKPDAGTRAWVEEKKLNERIEAELAQADPEFSEYMRARRSKDIETARKIEGANPNYLEAKRAEWWRQRYAEADIQILDKKYDEVLRLLVSPVSPARPAARDKREPHRLNPTK